MYRKVIGILIGGLVLLSAGQYDRILQNIEGRRASTDASFEVVISIFTVKGEDTLQYAKYKVYYKGEGKTLVQQLAPASAKDNLILMLEGDMWFYKKGNRRPLRITPQQRLVGGASNADIAHFGFSRNYLVESIEHDSSGGMTILNLKAKHKYLIYPKIRLYLDTANKQYVAAEFYSLSGQALKKAYYKNYRLFAHDLMVPELIEIHDLIFVRDKVTYIRYHAIREKKISGKYFNFDYLVHFKE